MKKIFAVILITMSTMALSGAGYKGTLPNLDANKSDFVTPSKKNAGDILPLDKLTIPIRNTKIVDKVGVKYTEEMIEVVRQLERIKEVLDTDKSYKNFIAAANVLNLTSQNVLDKYQEERFTATNKLLSDINDDTQQIRDYWIKINRNAPYVSYYTTKGAYSGAVLNEQLNNFSNVLGYAIRELKESIHNQK